VSPSLLPLALRGLALMALTFGALLLHQPGARSVGSPSQVALFVAVMGLAALVYLETIRFILKFRQPSQAIWLILAVAVVLRAGLLGAPFLLSSDIYRYVWDGRVQAAGINPYRYVPADPALKRLRDPAIYSNINRKTYARTIYPPAAQLVFAAVGRISQSVLAMKLAMMAFEALAIFCLLRILSLARLPAERVAIYAWNPLVLLSFALDGHVDAIAIGLLAAALLLRARRSFGLAGGLLAGAALVKFLPIIVAPALLRGGRFWRPAAIGLAVILLLYALYSAVGLHVLGFLPSYNQEEGFAGGSGFWLLAGLAHLMPLPAFAPRLYILTAGLFYAALCWSLARERLAAAPADATARDVIRLCRDSGILIGAVMVAVSPHYPWYFAWAAVPAVVAPIPAVIWLSVAPLALYLDPLGSRFLWPGLVFAPAIAFALFALWQRRQAAAFAVPSPEGTAR
jgi:alpha-1,6-mannosyltransferase